jgi:hypothetical protein
VATGMPVDEAMMQDIFEFWSLMPKSGRIHHADKEVFQRIDPKRHGFRSECLPVSFSGPLLRFREDPTGR